MNKFKPYGLSPIRSVGKVIDAKADKDGVFVKMAVNTEMSLAIGNKSLTQEDIIDYIKKQNKWKIMTKKRILKAIYEAYMLGRDNIKLEKDREPFLAFGLLPRVKNKGLKAKL